MTLLREPDLGTPAVPSGAAAGAEVTVRIDGAAVTVPAGTSVMRAAALAGLDIPRLCATDSLTAFGSCRLCLVEIDSRKGTPASCTTPCGPEMVVTTDSPRLARLRRGVMELYLSDHPQHCLPADTAGTADHGDHGDTAETAGTADHGDNGECELTALAARVGLRDVRYGFEGENHLDAHKDESNPYFTFDPAECIACSRCVRACDEVQGTFALTTAGRGFGSRVSASAGESFMAS
ncbi:MAG TPA: 2Fe-2S iron-sulfur cluster-binding protein, partial [Dermatophilaceae bacterium]